MAKSSEKGGDISRLPKWAQEEIKLLRMRLSEANQKLEAFLDDQTPSAFWVEELGPEDERYPCVPRYIQADRIICEANGIRVEVSSTGSDDGVTIMFSSRGRVGRGYIKPQASNHIVIVPEK